MTQNVHSAVWEGSAAKKLVRVSVAVREDITGSSAINSVPMVVTMIYATRIQDNA